MRLPVILQADRSECGLACLAMVAGFYGHHATLRELRTRFRMSTRGATLRKLHDCGEQLGLNCRAVRVELKELRQLRVPAILHWEFDHFVVLKSVNRRGLSIVDPALGARLLSIDDVSSRFTGVALELAPTPALARKKAVNPVKLSSFLTAFRGLAGTLGAVFAMTALLQVFALAMPLQMQFTVDQGIRQGDMNIVVALAAGFGSIAVISAVTDYFRSLLVLYAGNTAAFRMVGGLVHHLLRLPDAWFTARHPGDVLSRFNSITPVREFLMSGAFAMLVDSIMAIGAFAVLLLYSWQMTLALCGFLTISSALRLATYAPLKHLTHESIAAEALEESSFIENVQRHRSIKLLGAEADREDAWGQRYVTSINAEARLRRFGIHLQLAATAITAVETAVMLLLGASQVIADAFTLGMLFAFNSYSGMFAARVHALVRAFLDMRMLRLHRERIADIGLEEREVPAGKHGIRAGLRGAITVRSLSYAYNDEEGPVLQGLDLNVTPGEFLAVSGESGAGKSTLIKLLAKLLTPDEGEIRIDGHDIRLLDTAHYRRQLGVVMQDDDLLSGSLLENIAAGEARPDLAQAARAAQLACIDEDIRRMPMQYLTLVGHMGSTLSGGQRQRLMIARAVYRQPRILLLDEGTAHLNDALQRRVLANLAGLGITIIVVTHDPRVVECADRCMHIKNQDLGFQENDTTDIEAGSEYQAGQPCGQRRAQENHHRHSQHQYPERNGASEDVSERDIGVRD